MALTQEQKDALRARRQAKTIEPADVSRETPSFEEQLIANSHAGEIGWYNDKGEWVPGLKPLEEHIEASSVSMEDILSSQKTPEAQAVLEQIAQESYNGLDGDEEYIDAQDVPWAQGRHNDFLSMLAPIQPTEIVRGFAISKDMSQEQREDLSEMVHTYIGVIPRKIGNYAGRWVKVVGCVVQPTSGTKNVVDRKTGEVVQQHLQWDIPIFKLASIDQDTGMNIVAAGGGRYGLQFAMEMTALFGPGDWHKPRMMFVSQEEREGVGEDGEKSPRRMYRFNHRRVTAEDK